MAGPTVVSPHRRVAGHNHRNLFPIRASRAAATPIFPSCVATGHLLPHEQFMVYISVTVRRTLCDVHGNRLFCRFIL